MKSFIKFILTMLLTGLMSLGILIIASRIFVPKWINHDWNMMSFIIKGFYEEPKDSLDVIFMGNSDTYRGIDPLVMYHEYGFTSYNYVAAGQRMWVAYAMLEDALLTQHPKLILFNVDEAYYESQTSFGNYSKVFDNMRFSFAKIRGVFDSNYIETIENKIAKFLPILYYHSRYNELSNEDFKYAFYDYHYPLKGMDMVADQVPYTGNANYMEDIGEVEELPEVTIKYLDKMKKKCDEEGIQFVLFHTVSSDSAYYARYLPIKEYADNNKLDFIELNFFTKEIGIDWEKDTSDGGDHLNMYGAEKSSLFLGEYLKENYELPDHRKNKKFEYWEDDYNTYLKERKLEAE